MSSVVDSAVLTQLRTITGVHIYDGYVTDSDESAQTISAALPYAVYYTALGRSVNASANRRRARAMEFQVNFVGLSREQAIWAAEKIDALVDEMPIIVAGKSHKVFRTEDDLFVRRDDTWTRPDGGPLFFGTLRYGVKSR